MSVFPVAEIGSGRSLSLASRQHQEHENSCTKRVAELETLVTRLRIELQEAEAALEREKTRMPIPGDFVRCPLTNFFGLVTKVTDRPHGRPWIEILPYLGPNLPGHLAMDLFDSWELIDPPSESDDGSQTLPTIAPFMSGAKPLVSIHSEEIEESMRKLWTPSSETPSRAS